MNVGRRIQNGRELPSSRFGDEVAAKQEPELEEELDLDPSCEGQAERVSSDSAQAVVGGRSIADPDRSTAGGVDGECRADSAVLASRLADSQRHFEREASRVWERDLSIVVRKIGGGIWDTSR